MLRVFFSYSHRDEGVRDELEVHLAMLKQQGVLAAWHDRRVLAGDEYKGVISDYLETADIILLLVSPYFLASSYCYEIEVKRALERHAAKEAHVIPVIVDPCDWLQAPFAKLATLPKDGKPISKYPNRHDAFLEVVQAIRAVAHQRPARPSGADRVVPGPPSEERRVVELPRSSNLRLRKTFTDHDRDTFLETSYEYVAKFFEQSLIELQTRNPGVTGSFQSVTTRHFTVEIYRQGKSVAACGIRLGGFFKGKQIVFTHDPHSMNSMNAMVDVVDDGQHLFLKSGGWSGVVSVQRSDKEQLTPQGAAELFWGLLISPLQ